MTFQRSIIVALAVVMAAGQAMAQAQAPKQPPAPQPGGALPMPSDPAQTTASYGDWVLRCVRTGDKGTGPRVCELVQTMVLQGQQQPVAQVAVGYDKNELKMTLLVPPAVSFSRAPTLSVPGPTGPFFDLAWRRCLPNGCFADIAVAAELLKLLRSRGDPMQVDFQGCRRARRLAAVLDARAGPRARRAGQGAALALRLARPFGRLAPGERQRHRGDDQRERHGIEPGDRARPSSARCCRSRCTAPPAWSGRRPPPAARG